jgi:hypothetical protein
LRVDRGFVPRAEAVSRLTTAMNFLEKKAAFSRRLHWMNGNDGKVIPFGTKTTAEI